MTGFKALLIQVIDIYIIIIIIRAVLSWIHVNPYGNFFQIYLFLIKITEPVLHRLRELQKRFFPQSPIDFSPLIALLTLLLLKRIIIGV